MTLFCAECGSDSIVDTDAPWDVGKIPACPFCRQPLRDRLGKRLLGRDDENGWCHRTDLHERRRAISYAEDRWDWRDRDLFDYRDLMPAGEVAEMAANAEPAEMDLEESR